jgi:hypothetical protein
LLAELLKATINSVLAAFDECARLLEQQVVTWMLEAFGMTAQGSGILVMVLAVTPCARFRSTPNSESSWVRCMRPFDATAPRVTCRPTLPSVPHYPRWPVRHSRVHYQPP